MSVEGEIEALREDVRSLRAMIDSFFKSFNGDVMSRLATLEQWKISHSSELSRAVEKTDETQKDIHALTQAVAQVSPMNASVKDLNEEVKGLKSQNDQQQGSINMLRFIGTGITIVMGAIELYVHVFAGKGH